MEPFPKRYRSESRTFWSDTQAPNHHDWGNFKQSNGGGDVECRRFNTLEGCPYGASCRFRHSSTDGTDIGWRGFSSGGKPKPCMKFFSTSGCPFGESCHFLRYIPGGVSTLGLAPIVSLSSTSMIASQTIPAATSGDPSVTVNGFKTKLCNQFNTSEGCRFGEKCHFAHGDSDLRLPNNPSRGKGRQSMVGPSGTAPHPEFANGGSNSNSTSFENSKFYSQSYGELNPPDIAAQNGPTNYPSGSFGENAHAY